jgi:ketosteroid isomerase-like protein
VNDAVPLQDLAGRFLDAVERNDLAAVGALYDDAIEVHHNLDGASQSKADNLQALAASAARLRRRRYVDRRMHVFEGGFVHQHVLEAERLDGKILRIPMAMVALVHDGRIHRIDEYLDGDALRQLRAPIDGR